MVISTVWAFIFFIIEAIGLIVLSIVILALAGGHIGDPFTNLGGTAGLGGLALAFPIAISGFVGWENSGALAEETKNARDQFNWFRHLIVPLIGIGVLALPIWGFFAPGQQAPYNSFGWILLGLIAISVAWAIYVIAARPQAATSLGTMIADE